MTKDYGKRVITEDVDCGNWTTEMTNKRKIIPICPDCGYEMSKGVVESGLHRELKSDEEATLMTVWACRCKPEGSPLSNACFGASIHNPFADMASDDDKQRVWPPTAEPTKVNRVDGGGLMATFLPEEARGWRDDDTVVIVHADHWLDTNNHIIGLEAQVKALEEQLRKIGPMLGQVAAPEPKPTPKPTGPQPGIGVVTTFNRPDRR